MDDFERMLQATFLEEAEQLLADAEQCFLNLETAVDDSSMIEKIFRLAHNLKGSAAAAGFDDMARLTHQFESLVLKLKKQELPTDKVAIDLLLRCNDFLAQMVQALKTNPHSRCDVDGLIAAIQLAMSGISPLVAQPLATSAVIDAATTEGDNKPEEAEGIPKPVQLNAGLKPSTPVATPAEEHIRVSLRRLDQLMNDVGELVILQTVLAQYRQSATVPLLVQRTVGQLTKLTKSIQDIAMGLRMVPVRQTCQKMQRVARDTAASVGKTINFVTSGEETELDKTLLDLIGDPLVHLVRNAIDHGLETPAERAAAGKTEAGLVHLSAFHRGEHTVIEVRDDGRGLDARKLVAKAVQSGLLRQASDCASDQEAYRLIFAAGFSTKEEVSAVSGRGVGMDVVRANIEQAQGEIQIETELGVGTTMRILLPLTLAIIDGMIIRLGSERFVVPLVTVHESLSLQPSDVSTMVGRSEVMNVRGETMPLLRLDRMLGRPPARTTTLPTGAAPSSIAIVFRPAGYNPFGVLVDDIVGQHQVVVKRLGEEIRGIPGVSGAAILGDGKAALILDIFDIAANHIGRKRRDQTLPREAA